jgi:hypothetical protein
MRFTGACVAYSATANLTVGPSDGDLKSRLVQIARQLSDGGLRPFQRWFQGEEQKGNRPHQLPPEKLSEHLVAAYLGRDVLRLLDGAGLANVLLHDVSAAVGERTAQNIIQLAVEEHVQSQQIESQSQDNVTPKTADKVTAINVISAIITITLGIGLLGGVVAAILIFAWVIAKIVAVIFMIGGAAALYHEKKFVRFLSIIAVMIAMNINGFANDLRYGPEASDRTSSSPATDK